jgi:hypothetical protein
MKKRKEIKLNGCSKLLDMIVRREDAVLRNYNIYQTNHYCF